MRVKYNLLAKKWLYDTYVMKYMSPGKHPSSDFIAFLFTIIVFIFIFFLQCSKWVRVVVMVFPGYLVTYICTGGICGNKLRNVQTGFVPTPHTGTLDIVSTLRNKLTKVGISDFVRNFLRQPSDVRIAIGFPHATSIRK